MTDIEQSEYSKGFERKGDWMQTYTGRQFWPLDPHPDDIDIKDIAHALSLNCRYAGHCRMFYSVAEHSVHVSKKASNPNKLAALLHDASEAYLSDIVRPIKPFLPGYTELERSIEECIAEKFGLPYPWPDEIKVLDNSILADEQEQLMAPAPAPWMLTYPKLGVKLECWRPADARREFLFQFQLLTGEIGGH